MFFSLRKTIEDRLQDSLHKTLEKTKSPLVFGHVCWGVLSEPGAFRMTRIVPTTNARLPLVEFLKLRGVEQQEALRRHIHEEALRRHIMRFERSGILLDWITRWMYDKCEPGTEPRRSLTFSFLVSREHDAPCFGTNDHSLIVSQEFFNTLVHEPIVREYLQALYLPDNPDNTPDVSSGSSGVLRYAADQLIGLRFTARALIEENTECGSALRRLSGVYIEEGQPACPTPKHQWMFLEALQTGLMYVDAARIDGAAARGFVSFGVCYQVYEDKKPTDNPLAVISFVIPSDVDEGYTSSMREEVKAILEGTLEGAIRSVGLCRDRPQWDRLLQISHARWDPEKIRGILVKDLTLAFSVKAFPNWAPALTLWLSLITDKLRSSIHEGQPLNFYFVVADRSQVLDSGLFEVIELDFHDERDGLVPWKDDGEIRGDEEVESLLQRIGRYIGKKNYAWFLDGRYALLWDATFPSKYPHNLIRFKESSWDVFINHARMGKKSKAINFVTALVSVSGDGAGGILVNGEQVASFRKGDLWIVGATDRNNQLSACIERHLRSWGLPDNVFQSTVRVMCGALLAISEDPHAGCLLCIYENEQNPAFEHMGEPWKTIDGNDPLNMTRDELTALMAMDGATCLSRDTKGKPTVKFRRLVSVSDEPLRDFDKDVKDKLDGEGSRKWSAANAARRSEIAVVISVSQDGPMHIYAPDQKTKTVTITTL